MAVNSLTLRSQLSIFLFFSLALFDNFAPYHEPQAPIIAPNKEAAKDESRKFSIVLKEHIFKFPIPLNIKLLFVFQQPNSNPSAILRDKFNLCGF